MNRFVLFFLAAFSISVASSGYGDQFEAFEFPQEEIYETQVPQLEPYLQRFGEEEAKKYELVYVQESSDDFDAFNEAPLYLLFDYSGDFTIQNARELLVNVISDFVTKLDLLNRNPKGEDQGVIDFFKNEPFDFEDLSIKIRYKKKTKLFVYPTLENVSSIFLLDGRLYYETINPKSYTPNILRSESYKEAKALVDQEAAKAAQANTILDKLRNQ